MYKAASGFRRTTPSFAKLLLCRLHTQKAVAAVITSLYYTDGHHSVTGFWRTANAKMSLHKTSVVGKSHWEYFRTFSWATIPNRHWEYGLHIMDRTHIVNTVMILYSTRCFCIQHTPKTNLVPITYACMRFNPDSQNVCSWNFTVRVSALVSSLFHE